MAALEAGTVSDRPMPTWGKAICERKEGQQLLARQL